MCELFVCVLHCWRAHHIVRAVRRRPARTLDRNRAAAFVAKFNESARKQQRARCLLGANENLPLVYSSMRATPLFSPVRRLHGKVLERNRKFRGAAGMDGYRRGGALKIVIPSSLWVERLEI